MHGVSGGGSESQSCSRCHDEGNTVDSNGVTHPTILSHDGTHTSCTLSSLGSRGGILDLYFEQSHINTVTIYGVYYNGWEKWLAHNGFKVLYTTDKESYDQVVFDVGATHESGDHIDDTYGNGNFKNWTECFRSFPEKDQYGRPMTTTIDTGIWDEFPGAKTVDCIAEDAVGIRVWQNNFGHHEVSQMFLHEVDVFGRELAPPDPPKPPPPPPGLPPYPPGLKPPSSPLPPELYIEDCYMDVAGTGTVEILNDCSKCYNDKRDSGCYATAGSNGAILDMYFDPSDITNVVVLLTGFHHGRDSLLGQRGWKVFYTTTKDVYDNNTFYGVKLATDRTYSAVAPSLSFHEGFGPDWNICYEEFPEFDDNGRPYTSPLFQRSYSATGGLDQEKGITVACAGKGAVGIRIWQLGDLNYAGAMFLDEVNVHGYKINPPAPPKPPYSTPSPPSPPPPPLKTPPPSPPATPPPSPQPVLDITGCFMNGVVGGGSASQSCTRCHDEGNMIDSNGVAHPTTAPHDETHTSCTLNNLGSRGGILDLYFEPSHISMAIVYPVFYRGWEQFLGHNGWKVFYTTDVDAQHTAETFQPGEAHTSGGLEGDTYGNGRFEKWTECFAQLPRFDDSGGLMSTTNNNVRWGVTGGKPSISVDCVGSDAVGIRLWQNNVGNDNVGQMFMYELDVFGRHLRLPSPPAPPPLPPMPPPYQPNNAPIPPPFAPILDVTGCFMEGAGTGGQSYSQCSNCHDGIRTNNCHHTTGSNGGILDIYFEPSTVSNVAVHLLNNGLLQQGGWKVFYTTNPEARNMDNFQGVTTNVGTLAPSLTAHEGFGEDWKVCYENFPDYDLSGRPWTSPLFTRANIPSAYLATIKCEAVVAVGIRVWQMSHNHAGQMKIAEVDVHGRRLFPPPPPYPPPSPPSPPLPPSPPPMPPFSWPDKFGDAPDDGICSKHFDYVLIMQWSVGSMSGYADRDGLAGASSKEDIMAVAGAWISSFEHGVGLARGGILMLYNGGAVWATEFPQTDVRDVLTEFNSWLDANEKKEQPTGSEIAAALDIVNDKFTDSGDLSKATQQVVYNFFFDYNGLAETHSTFMAMKSKYHVYIMSFGGMLPSAYLWPHWMDVYTNSNSVCLSSPCLTGYTENVADAVRVHASEECFGTPNPCHRGDPSGACAAPPPPSPTPPPSPPSLPPYPPILPGIIVPFQTRDLLRAALTEYNNNPTSAREKYGLVSRWDVSVISDMNRLFYRDYTFNEPIGSWDTSSVTNMEIMFEQSIFNQPLLNWDTSSVTDMRFMFSDAAQFNQPLSFDTSSVTTMSAMFHRAYKFNQPLDFDTGSVKDMSYMIKQAGVFNQPLSFDMSSVTSTYQMFSGASSFSYQEPVMP